MCGFSGVFFSLLLFSVSGFGRVKNEDVCSCNCGCYCDDIIYCVSMTQKAMCQKVLLEV